MTAEENSQKNASDGPNGIGGWLILPILGFVGAIINVGKKYGDLYVSGDLVDGALHIFTTTTTPLASLRIPMAFALVSAILVILSAIYCLYLTFSKKQKLIKFATFHYLLIAIFGLIDLWVAITLESAVPAMKLEMKSILAAIQGFIPLLIWAPYFHLSKRVENTFIK